ncbi:hypothetical protein OnM2_059062 [Erysiphe neolycopersici]|uniref:Uncharacterized protein n=1 Tax=Erysiphe neolycopersici TaxID=212602 RepID=A0A420HQ49_9PEZI|nr:hypothetical protein OnM2_059062 [Erysiphe neolycopersici]
MILTGDRILEENQFSSKTINIICLTAVRPHSEIGYDYPNRTGAASTNKYNLNRPQAIGILYKLIFAGRWIKGNRSEIADALSRRVFNNPIATRNEELEKRGQVETDKIGQLERVWKGR